MKGSNDFFGKDRLAVVLINDAGNGKRDVKRSNEFVERYGMDFAARVRMEAEECSAELVATFGQFSWGYTVIASDGTLAGVDVSRRQLLSVLERATERPIPVREGFEVTTRVKGGGYGIGFADVLPKDREVTLTVSLALPDGWHVYGEGENQPFPTELKVNYAPGLEVGVPVIPAGTPARGESSHIDGPVKIQVKIVFPKGTAIGKHMVHGTLSYMACNEEGCLPAVSQPWVAPVSVL